MAVLAVRATTKWCALPLTLVGETMRPLPVEPLRAMPAFVRGFAIVRGEAVPVVDLEALVSGAPGASGKRFVTLRISEGHTLALLVDEVLGVLSLPASTFNALPSLLRDAGQVASAIGARDQQLLMMLDASRLLPDEVWKALDERPGAP